MHNEIGTQICWIYDRRGNFKSANQIAAERGLAVNASGIVIGTAADAAALSAANLDQIAALAWEATARRDAARAALAALAR